MTSPKASDGDGVDIFLGRYPMSKIVFVIDQKDPDTGSFDEPKCFIGFTSKFSAINTYLMSFSDKRGSDRFGHITQMTIQEFKHWLEHGDTTKPIRYKAAA